LRQAYVTHHPQLPEFLAAAIKTFAERELVMSATGLTRTLILA
jgi:hypothetical protein